MLRDRAGRAGGCWVPQCIPLAAELPGHRGPSCRMGAVASTPRQWATHGLASSRPEEPWLHTLEIRGGNRCLAR